MFPNPSTRGVTKRCRLYWLTNSALVYEPKCGESGEGGSRMVSANEYSCTQEPKLTLEILTLCPLPYILPFLSLILLIQAQFRQRRTPRWSGNGPPVLQSSPHPLLHLSQYHLFCSWRCCSGSEKIPCEAETVPQYSSPHPAPTHSSPSVNITYFAHVGAVLKAKNSPVKRKRSPSKPVLTPPPPTPPPQSLSPILLMVGTVPTAKNSPVKRKRSPSTPILTPPTHPPQSISPILLM